MIQVLVSLVLTQPCICWPFPPLRCHSSVLTRSPVLGCGQVALQWAQLLLEGACERAFTCRNLLFLALKELLRRSTPTRGMWYHATVASDSVQSHLPVADHPVPIALIKGSANDSMPVALPVTNDLVLLSWSSHLDVLSVDLGSFFVSHLCLYWLSAQMLVIVWCNPCRLLPLDAYLVRVDPLSAFTLLVRVESPVWWFYSIRESFVCSY